MIRILQKYSFFAQYKRQIKTTNTVYIHKKSQPYRKIKVGMEYAYINTDSLS